jgi:hypothetical protein
MEVSTWVQFLESHRSSPVHHRRYPKDFCEERWVQLQESWKSHDKRSGRPSRKEIKIHTIVGSHGTRKSKKL